jgi:hypothetical protein
MAVSSHVTSLSFLVSDWRYRLRFKVCVQRLIFSLNSTIISFIAFIFALYLYYGMPIQVGHNPALTPPGVIYFLFWCSCLCKIVGFIILPKVLLNNILGFVDLWLFCAVFNDMGVRKVWKFLFWNIGFMTHEFEITDWQYCSTYGHWSLGVKSYGEPWFRPTDYMFFIIRSWSDSIHSLTGHNHSMTGTGQSGGCHVTQSRDLCQSLSDGQSLRDRGGVCVSMCVWGGSVPGG